MDTALLSLAVAFINLSIGIIVLIRGNGHKMSGFVFISTLFCSLWGLFDYLTLTAISSQHAFYLGGVRTIFSYLTIVSVAHYIFLYVGWKKLAVTVYSSALYLLTLLFIYARFFTDYLAKEMAYSSGYFIIIPGKFYFLPVLLSFLITTYAAIVLLNYYKLVQDNRRRAQTLLLIVGVVGALLLAIVSYAVLPYFGIGEQYLGVIAVGALPIAIGLSSLQYDLNTSLSLTTGTIRSKVFTAAMLATFIVILPAIILLSIIYIGDADLRSDYQMRGDVIEREREITNYLGDLQDRAAQYALSEGNTVVPDDLLHEVYETKDTENAILSFSIVYEDGTEIIGVGDYSKEVSSWIGDIAEIRPQVLGVIEISKTSLIVVAAPVPTTFDNPLQRYAILTFSADKLFEISSQSNSSLFETSKSYIVDNRSRMITPYANYDHSLLFSLQGQGTSSHCQPIGESNIEFTSYLDLRQVPVMGTRVLLPVKGWCMYAEVDKQELENTKTKMIISTVSIGMLCVLLVTLIAELIGSVISKPVLLLKAGVSRIQAGDFSTPVAVNSDDEIGELSRDFDRMTFDLRDARSNITAKVKEQTKDLEEQKSALVTQQKQMVTLVTELESEKDKSDLLAQDLEKFKQAADYATDHIIITDVEGRIIYANDAVKRISGYSPKEVLGQKAGSKDNWGGKMEPTFYKKLWKTIKVDKKPFRGEITNIGKNGVPYIVYSTISPVLDDNKEVIFFIGIERDITRDKEIDKAKSEFVSLASHQLRTPLSAINWYSEMLLDGDAGKLNSNQKEFVKEIYDGNQRMIELVGALLNVSRLELGTFIVEPVELQLESLAKAALKELMPLIKEKKISVKSMFGKLPDVLVDKKLTYIIFQNILSNAVKYTQDKGTVMLSLEKVSSNIVITVSDNGMGIPKEQLTRIYEKLFRASNAKESVTEGTGLGLYIVKSILDATGGSISVESELGKGTTFTVKIPSKGMKAKAGTKKLN